MISRPNDSDLLFKLAVCRDNREAHDEALQLMHRLVSVKRYEPAARWLLDKEYLKTPWAELDKSKRDEFGQLLKMVHEESPRDLVVTQLYAEYLLAENRLTLAVGLLEELAVVQPMRGLQAAAISRQLGNERSAVRLATQTSRQVGKLGQEDPSNSSLWLASAQCELFLRNYSKAIETLEKAIPLAKTPENAAMLRQALGDSMVAWIASIESSPSNTPEQKLQVLKMLQSALQYAPNNPRVLMLVANKVLETIEDSDASIITARNSLVAGTSPGISHFIRGTAAMMKDDTKNAEMHLAIAAQHLPKSGAISNNLAVALTARPDADLDQALKLSQTAINQTPDASPHFYETRGQILLKMERYLDAVPELERALVVPDLAPAAHQSLARCYEKLGQEELSRDHEAASKRLPEAQN